MSSAVQIVILFGLVTQLIGFLKTVLIAATLGISPELDGYYLALVLPTFVPGVVTGLLQSGFIPVYVQLRVNGHEVEAAALRSAVLSWTLVILCSITIPLCFVPALGRALALEGHLATQASITFVEWFPVLIWVTVLNGAADSLGLILNAERRFAAAAIGPAANAAITAAVFAVWPEYGIANLSWGLLLGIAVQLVILAIALARARVAIRFSLRAPQSVRSVVKLMGPTALSSVLSNFILAFVQYVAAPLGAGAVTALGFASRFHNAILQSAVLSVSAILLPHFSHLVAEGNTAELKVLLRRTFCYVVLVSFALFGIIAFSSEFVVGTLLERGRFTAGDTHTVSVLWTMFSLGIFGIAWGIFLAKLFQALQKPRVIARLAVISLIAHVALTVLFVRFVGLPGIALAQAVAYTIVTVLYGRELHRLGLGVDLFKLRTFLIRAVCCNAAAFAAAGAIAFSSEPSAYRSMIQAVIVGATNGWLIWRVAGNRAENPVRASGT